VLAKNREVDVPSLIPSTYDRADVLMSAGCSTFVSAALVLVIPRVGIVLLEILLGLFFIGCAVAARSRLRGRSGAREASEDTGSGQARTKWFDRYDFFLIAAVIVIYSCVSGLLRKVGLSIGTVGILPLLLVAVGILLKPRLLQFVGTRFKKRLADAAAERETVTGAGRSSRE
jgi:hypothetical protein